MRNFVAGMLFILLLSYGISRFNEAHSPVSTKTMSTDGYEFYSKEYTNQHTLITTRIFKTRAEFNAEAERLGIQVDYGEEFLMAFSLVEKDPRFCTIYMVDQAVEYTPSFVGHEFLHCVHGQWHVSNTSKGKK